MGKGDIGARLEGLRRLQPADPAQDQFYNGLSSIASGAVLQPSSMASQAEKHAEDAVLASEVFDVKPAEVSASVVATRTKGQGAAVRRPRKPQPISPQKRAGTTVAVRVGIVVRPDYAARIAKLSEVAKSTPDEVVRRIWREWRCRIIAELPETATTMIVAPHQRAAERGLYLGTTITLASTVLSAIAAEHDPLGIHGYAKLVKCAITPEFEKAIEAELKQAGF